GHFLEAAVKVPDFSIGVGYLFAVEPAYDPESAMSSGMGWTDVYYSRLAGQPIGIFVRTPLGHILNRQLVVMRERSASAGIVVFPEGMTDEFLVTENTPQVRVVGKSNPEHVVSFALPPVCRFPNRRDRVNFGLGLRQGDLEPKAVTAIDRVEVIY